MGLKEELLACKDLPVKPVEFAGVPGWEGRKDVFVRVLTGRERNEWEAYTLRLNESGDAVFHREDVWAKMTVLACCDAAGKRVFDDRDMAAVTAKSGRALKAIYRAAKELNQLDADEANDPNSKKVDGNGSSSTSAGTSESSTPKNSSTAATPAA
jgi:hypothetical protein